MADDKTAITELATALGCLDHGTAGWAVLQRPPELLVDDEGWDQLERGLHDDDLAALAEEAFANGVAFAHHRDGLDGRRPRRIEWTGGRRPPGDQVIPADLRIDRVWLVSCKYFSRVLHNAAPARVFDALLAPGPYQRADWYGRVAAEEHRALAHRAVALLDCDFPDDPVDATPDDRRRLRDALRAEGRRWPEPLVEPYQALCARVSEATAAHWRRTASTKAAREQLLWRILRLASAPYFVVGIGDDGPMRLRIDTPWDWRQAFKLVDFAIEADVVGQPQVSWTATVEDRHSGAERHVAGHVEVRWSHGKFGAPPEAKVYLDTPHTEVPGYVVLD